MTLSILSSGVRTVGGSLVDLLQTAARRGNGQAVPGRAAPAPAPTLTLGLSGAGSDVARSDVARTMESVAETSKAMRRQTAAAAKEKLQRLVDEAKLLRQFGGDPRLSARRAAELAKEIGDAARDFAVSADAPSIGSGSVSTPVSLSVPAAGSAAAATAPASAADGDAAALEGQATAEAARAEDVARSAQADQASPDAQSSPGAKSSPDAQSSPDAKPSPDGQDPAAARQALVEKLSADGNAGKARTAAIDDERLLFAKVKSALAGLRSLIERGVEEARKKKDPAETDEAERRRKEADRADENLDAAAATIGRQGEGETASAAPPPAPVNVVA